MSAQPKLLDALKLFVEAPGELITREMLMEALWPGLFVTDGSLAQVIRKLRKAIDDDPRDPRFLATVHRRGYRWIAEPAVPVPTRPVPVAAPAVVGRQAELARLRDALDQSRLVTLLGPGGIGKTTLARALAAERHGVVVPLASARDGRGVHEALLEALGLGGVVDPLDTPAVHLAGARSGGLVVLDNAEQVLDPVRELVRGMGEVAVLVTSREPLAMPREHCVELGPLGADEALALLRHQAERAGVDLSGVVPEVLEGLVDRLEAVPLALVLAAPVLRLMRAGPLVERLERSVGWLRDRRAPEARHRSLRANVAWSWDLLDDAARSALVDCTVFRGVFALDDALGVLGDDAFDLLAELRDRSVLVQRGGGLGVQEPMRELARESRDAARASALARRHGSWFCARAEAMEAACDTWSARRIDLENLWAAWDRLAETPLASRVARALWTVHTERAAGLSLEPVLDAALATADPADRGPLLARRAALRRRDNRAEAARADAEAALPHLGDDVHGRCVAEVVLAWDTFERLGDPDAAIARLEALRPSVDPVHDVYLAGHIASVANRVGRDALGALAEVVERARLLGARTLQASFGIEYGMALHLSGQVERAIAVYDMVLAEDGTGATEARVRCLVNRSEALVGLDRADEGLADAERAHALTRDLGRNALDVRAALCSAAAMVGRLDEARGHGRRYLELAERSGNWLTRTEAWITLATLELVEDRLSAASAHLDEADAVLHVAPDHPYGSLVAQLRALTLARRGDAVAARALLDAHQDDSPFARVAEVEVRRAEGSRVEALLAALPDDGEGTWIAALLNRRARRGVV